MKLYMRETVFLSQFYYSWPFFQKKKKKKAESIEYVQNKLPCTEISHINFRFLKTIRLSKRQS
jgi:GH18 family chitinase